MFTGIIEQLGTIVKVEREADNIHFTIEAEMATELKIDQSVAHDGVCLTVVAIADKQFVVTAIKETLDRTALHHWKVGRKVNLERCMVMNGRLDGHIVQGHVDQRAVVHAIQEEGGSWRVKLDLGHHSPLIVQKGSICINGVSLTAVDPEDRFVSVAIIPFTWEQTTFHQLKAGDFVNIEFDIIGKYVQKMFPESSLALG